MPENNRRRWYLVAIQDKRSKIIMFVIFFAAIGTAALLLTRAATPATSVETENGTITGGAGVVGSSSGASGNSYVKFGSGNACTDPTAGLPNVVQVNNASELQSKINANGTNAVFRLAPGEYRVGNITAKAGQKLYGTNGTDCSRATKINGSKLIGNWQQVSGRQVWVSDQGPSPLLTPRPLASDPNTDSSVDCQSDSAGNYIYPRCNYPHDLFVDNVPYKQVGMNDEVGPGTWFHDYADNKLYIGTNPNGKTTEVANHETFINPTVGNITIQNMVVEKFASQIQFGAIGKQAPPAIDGWKVIDNEIRLNHGSGVTLTLNGLIDKNYIHDNGHLGGKIVGVSSGGSSVDLNVNISGNVIAGNNAAYVKRGFEAGGVKIGNHPKKVTVTNNCVYNNNGNGLWTDVQASNVIYRANTVFNNNGQGIFYEISTQGTIEDNFVGGNFRSGDSGGNGGLYGSQIFISTSSNTVVRNNKVWVGRDLNGDGVLGAGDSGTGNGIGIIWQNRLSHDPNANARGNTAYGNEVTFLSSNGSNGLKGSAPEGTFAGGDEIYNLTTGSRFYNNTYHSRDGTSANNFAGLYNANRRENLTLAEQKTTGQESGSTIDTAVAGKAFSCNAWQSVIR